MASTKFYLDCRRAKPGQPSVLKIAIGHGNKTSYISLDARLLPARHREPEKQARLRNDSGMEAKPTQEMQSEVAAKAVMQPS